MNDDEQLLKLARHGDRTAFEQVLRPMIQPAYRVALAMLRDRDAAEDAVQQMALQAWRHRDRIRPELGTVRPWLLAIVANECRMARRERWHSVLRLGDLLGAGAREVDTDRTYDLRKAIDRLPYRHRLLLYLYFVLDLPVEEVARVLGISAAAVKSRLHRVTMRLRSNLSPEVFE